MKERKKEGKREGENEGKKAVEQGSQENKRGKRQGWDEERKFVITILTKLKEQKLGLTSRTIVRPERTA